MKRLPDLLGCPDVLLAVEQERGNIDAWEHSAKVGFGERSHRDLGADGMDLRRAITISSATISSDAFPLRRVSIHRGAH